MNQENGRKNAWGNSFLISTLQPSKVLGDADINEGGNALDLGSGNFRNAIFLASKGYEVDAVDIAELSSHLDEIDSELKKRIHFTVSDLNEYQMSGEYDIILACRLLQYLSPEKVTSLIDEAYDHLLFGGKFLMSVTTGGGIFNRTEIVVPKYQHDMASIIIQFEKRGFSTKTTKGSSINMHVNYTENVDTYDIEAIKTEKFISTR